MDNSLKMVLESLVLDFKKSLYQINIKDFNNPLLFAEKCQDLLNLYRSKLFDSTQSFTLHQQISEYFLENYVPSFKYHSECQIILEKYLEKSFLH